MIDVKGRVVNAQGEPVAGATITVQGTNKKVVTDVNGEFMLTGINEDAFISISHIQYETESLTINGRGIVNATLQIKIGKLDEVQIIAYGTTTRRFNTGNVGSVKATDIEKQPINNPLLALQGRIPGLFIVQNTGFPGGGISVRIQGQNSIGKGNDPLYVIDGVPYSSQLPPSISDIQGYSRPYNEGNNGLSSPGNPLNFLNPADIESIDVLKDADATAIYGSRAANGAILITTKKGKSGQTKISINAQNGWGKITRKAPLLNTSQYLQMRSEAKSNDNASISPNDYDINGTWDTTRYTDWQKVLLGGTSQYRDIQGTISGGTSNTQILLGAGYHYETLVFPGGLSDKKGSVHFSLSHTSTNQKFTVALSGNFLYDNNHFTNKDLTQTALWLAPNAPSIYNADGKLNWAQLDNGNSTWINPLSYLLNKYNIKTKNLISNATISYQLIKGLNIKSSFGYTNLDADEIYLRYLESIQPENRPFSSRGTVFGSSNSNSWIIEPQISYNKIIDNGKLDVLFGMSIQQNVNSRFQYAGLGFSSDVVMEDIRSAPITRIQSNLKSVYKYNAGFGRINYNLQDKYLLNLTARRDGSSRFGSNNQFHNFWSIGGAWIFSNEKIFKNKLPILSFGKIRASYGTTGNDQIGDYQYLNQYTPVGVDVLYQGAVGLLPNGLTNPFLQWEKTQKLQVGVDFGLYRDRLLANINYSQNRSSNQLLGYQLPITTGYSGITRNFPAMVQNSGWEISINATIIKSKELNWSSSFNVTIPKNKLVSFVNLATSTYSHGLILGQPINIVKVYHSLGVDPATGVYQFSDTKGGVTFRPDTAQDITQNIIINPTPAFYGGFQQTIQYKGFSLDFLFQFVKQKGPNYKFGQNPGGYTSGGLNQPTYVLSRWRKTGDITEIQRYNSDFSLADQFGIVTNSDAAWTDASYVRLKNLSLSWQIPGKWKRGLHLQETRIYIQGQNLITFTKYKGLDPENLSLTALPPLRVLTFGVQIGL